jgi:hypothetical protein
MIKSLNKNNKAFRRMNTSDLENSKILSHQKSSVSVLKAKLSFH